MNIRQAQQEDYIKIAALERLYMELPWSIDTMTAAALFGTVFFVEEDIKGYGSIKLIEDVAEINNICVDALYRKQGIATAIIKYMLQYACKRGVKKVILEVAENNKAAISLYAKNGFCPLYTRPNYYKDVGAIVMQNCLVGI